MSNTSLIKRAIKDKAQIHAKYKGHHRLMCPHAIGTRNGVKQALFLQFGGGSETRLTPNHAEDWRCLPVDELTEVRYFAGPFHTADNYSLQKNCMDTVDAEIL